MAIVNLDIDYSKHKIVSTINGAEPDDKGDVKLDISTSTGGYTVNDITSNSQLQSTINAIPQILLGDVQLNFGGTFPTNYFVSCTIPTRSGKRRIIIDGGGLVSQQPLEINMQSSEVVVVLKNITAQRYMFNGQDIGGTPASIELDNVATGVSVLGLGLSMIALNGVKLYVKNSVFSNTTVNNATGSIKLQNFAEAYINTSIANWSKPATVPITTSLLAESDGNFTKLVVNKDWPQDVVCYKTEASGIEAAFTQVGRKVLA